MEDISHTEYTGVKSRRKHVQKKNYPEKHSLKDTSLKRSKHSWRRHIHILYLSDRMLQTRSIKISRSLRPIPVTVQRLALLTSDL